MTESGVAVIAALRPRIVAVGRSHRRIALKSRYLVSGVDDPFPSTSSTSLLHSSTASSSPLSPLFSTPLTTIRVKHFAFVSFYSSSTSNSPLPLPCRVSQFSHKALGASRFFLSPVAFPTPLSFSSSFPTSFPLPLPSDILPSRLSLRPITRY
jgi:hypothetical protein